MIEVENNTPTENVVLSNDDERMKLRIIEYHDYDPEQQQEEEEQTELQYCLEQHSDIYVYYKFRLTLDFEVFDGKAALQPYISCTNSWFNWLIDQGFIDGKATGGCEVKGKTGDYVKPHFHIHFRSTSKKDCIAQAIRRKYFKDYEIKLKGNQMYSLKLDPYPDNDLKFFGYALKQQNPDKRLLVVSFTPTQARDLCVAGNAMFKSTCEFNSAKQMHREDKETLYDRLEEFLDEHGPTLENILKFYVEKEKKPINDGTIVGYYNLYRLRRQIITYAEYSAKLISKYNI